MAHVENIHIIYVDTQGVGHKTLLLICIVTSSQKT